MEMNSNVDLFDIFMLDNSLLWVLQFLIFSENVLSWMKPMVELMMF